MRVSIANFVRYEKNSPEGDGSGNSRNGYNTKTLQSDLGETVLRVPRDRNGEFEPKVIGKYQTKTDNLEQQIISMYAKGMSNRDSVLVRAAGNSSGKQVSKIYQKGSIVTLTGKTNTDKGYIWYGVKLQSGTAGYIRCDLLRIYAKDEKKQYEDNNNHSGNGGKKEAVYETLRKGSSGEAVKKLQVELKTQGYFSGSINGTYGTDTINAVKSFQSAKRLTVDGIVGPHTSTLCLARYR